MSSITSMLARAERCLWAVFVVCSVLGSAACAVAPRGPIRWLTCKSAYQIDGLKKLTTAYTKETGVEFAINQASSAYYRDKLTNMVAEERNPDFQAGGVDWLTYLTGARAMLPLDGLVKGSRLSLACQSKAAVQSWTYKKQLWGLPYAFSPVLLYYNRDLFDAAGLPSPPTSWEDRAWTWKAFAETAQKLTRLDANGNVAQAGVDTMQFPYMWPWYFGGDWADESNEKSRLMEPATIRGVQAVADLLLENGLVGAPSFASGRAAMSVQASSYTPRLRYAEFQWNLAVTPWGTEHSVPASVDAFSLGAGSQREAAWSFIRWLYRDGKRMGAWADADGGGVSVPTDRALFGSYLAEGKLKHPGLNLRVAADALEYARPLYLRYARNWLEIDELLTGVTRQVVSGEKSASSAFSQVNSEFQKLLDASGR